MEIPEFTCVCPMTGQPDFATLVLDYVPDRLCVELKSLKLYVWSYRDEGTFHEAVTNQILDDLARATQPRLMRLEARFNVRGGIYTTAIARWLARRYGIAQPDAETEVLPVNGSREALFAFAQTVLDSTRDARVVCPNPFYQIYEGAALLAGATPVYGAPERWEGVQLVYACSPANPSGRVMKLDAWREL